MSNILDIRCPSCKSKQLNTAEKTGNKLTLTCLSCGYSFKAADTDETPRKIIEQPSPATPPASHHTPASAIPDLPMLNKQIIEVAKASGKLGAIKYCKDLTGWSLDQCKKHVDGLIDQDRGKEWNAADPNEPSEPVAGFDQQIIEIARTKGKLHAVKYYKERSGKGLKEALEYVDKIVPPGVYKKTEGCFIATACYGHYDAEEVLVLRRYRDNVLQQTKTGRLLVRLYYDISPSMANFIQSKAPLKKLIRRYILQPLVKRLSYNAMI